MKIKNWITKEVVVISPEASVKEAFGLMKSLGIRHLPVTDSKGTLAGIITESDILRAFVAGENQ